MVAARRAGAAAGQGSRAAGAARRARGARRPARGGARGEELLPPAGTDPVDQERHSIGLHQDRLVVARGESGARDHPGARPAQAAPRLGPRADHRRLRESVEKRPPWAHDPTTWSGKEKTMFDLLLISLAAAAQEAPPVI